MTKSMMIGIMYAIVVGSTPVIECNNRTEPEEPTQVPSAIEEVVSGCEKIRSDIQPDFTRTKQQYILKVGEERILYKEWSDSIEYRNTMRKAKDDSLIRADELDRMTQTQVDPDRIKALAEEHFSKVSILARQYRASEARLTNARNSWQDADNELALTESRLNGYSSILEGCEE